MLFILVLDVNALCKSISLLYLMFNSIGNSPISSSRVGFGVEIVNFSIVLIMVNCMSVSSVISSLLIYQVSYPYKSASNIVVWYSFINVLVFICESILFLVVYIQTCRIDWMFVLFSFKCWVIFRSFVKVSPRYFIFFLTAYVLFPTIIFELSVLLFLLLNISTSLFFYNLFSNAICYIQYCKHIFQLVYIWTCYGYVMHK